MKIAYTYHGLSQRVGGVSRYFYEIVSRLKSDIDIKVISKYSNNLYFKEILDHNNLLFPNRNFKGKRLLEAFLQEHFLKTHLSHNSYDLIHHMGEDPRLFNYAKNTPVVITIHDMIPELFNTNKIRIEKRRQSIRKASAIICVSENTRRDLLKIYPDVDSTKVSVIYHGFNTRKEVDSSDLLGDYILYVGERESYKNFNFLVGSLANMLRKRQLKLICTGSSFTKEEIFSFQELGIRDLVISSGFVTDSKLASLYMYAKCLVYPSLYEGFGFPILESFENECPICISKASCFPEIAGNAANYFNPKNSQSVEDCVIEVLDNESYRNELIARGKKRIKLFTWENSTRQTLQLYKSLAE